MIHDEICTYELCKLAKEKGFRERCIEHYYDDTKDLYRSSTPQCYNFGGNTSDAPTQSLLQRWLREEKEVDIAVVPNISEVYSYIIYNIHCRDNRVVNTNAGYATYELALEDALKYALENLV